MVFIRTFLVLWTSLAVFSCSSFRAPSLNLLESRADYSGERQQENSLKNLNGELFSPYRTEAILTDVLIHPHEMPNGDYFVKGWIKIMVSKSRWEYSESPLVKTSNSEAVKTRNRRLKQSRNQNLGGKK